MRVNLIDASVASVDTLNLGLMPPCGVPGLAAKDRLWMQVTDDEDDDDDDERMDEEGQRREVKEEEGGRTRWIERPRDGTRARDNMPVRCFRWEAVGCCSRTCSNNNNKRRQATGQGDGATERE